MEMDLVQRSEILIKHAGYGPILLESMNETEMGNLKG
jgi:hypothetical protein